MVACEVKGRGEKCEGNSVVFAGIVCRVRRTHTKEGRREGGFSTVLRHTRRRKEVLLVART